MLISSLSVLYGIGRFRVTVSRRKLLRMDVKGKLFGVLLRHLESGNGSERVVHRTKHRNSDNRNHGPFRYALPEGCCGRIIMLHLLFETIEHLCFLTSATVLLIGEEHNGAAVTPFEGGCRRRTLE